jgi:hypothetical protein
MVHARPGLPRMLLRISGSSLGRPSGPGGGVEMRGGEVREGGEGEGRNRGEGCWQKEARQGGEVGVRGRGEGRLRGVTYTGDPSTPRKV